MADPVIVPLVNNTWTLVATAVMSAQIYPRGIVGPPPAMFRFTYRATGGAAPVNDIGVVVGLGDRDHAAPSYRAEFGGLVDLYIFAVTTAATTTAECEVHAPVGGAARETQPAIVVSDVAIVAAPVGGINVPSDDGIVMDGYPGIGWQVYLIGGQSVAHVNRTITAKFQGSNNLVVGAARRWEDIAVGYDYGTNEPQINWQSVGLTAVGALIDFDRFAFKRIRLNYSFDAAPHADHPGAIIVTERRY